MLEAPDRQAARRALERRYSVTEMQATAVMDLQFARLTALDRQKIEQRRQDLAAPVVALRRELGQG